MRKILVAVDLQNDFIDGALGTKEAVAIVDKACQVISSYDEKNVIATRDTHGENYFETQEGRNLPVRHCIRGTDGWQINGKIQTALRGAKIIDKPSFGSVELAECVRSLAAKEEISVTLIGLCTDICVVSNALLIKAFCPEVPVSVVASACAGVTPQAHQAALATMQSCQVQVLE